MSGLNKDNMLSPAVGTFAMAAEEFCALVAQSEALGRDRFLHAVLARLPSLYSAALALPAVEVDEDDGDVDDAKQQYGPDSVEDPESPEDDNEEDGLTWNFLFHSLGSLIGEGDYYAMVFSPYAQPPEELVTGSLADDIADIYRDLMGGLTLWRRGDVDAALWDWRILFTSHLGDHITSALRALHALAADCDLGFPRPNS